MIPLTQELKDVGKRCSEAVNLHLQAYGFEAKGKWVAIRLSDGGSDGALYDTREDAAKHQLHESQCAYMQITPDGITPSDAARWVALHRQAYDNGIRFSDPLQLVPKWG